MNQIANDLRAAADHIERWGWIQGQAFGPGDSGGAPACILGAIGIATGNYTVDGQPAYPACGLNDRYKAAEMALTRAFGAPWNDTPSRTAAEVIAKLREVADALDPQPSKPIEFFLGPPQPLADEDLSASISALA